MNTNSMHQKLIASGAMQAIVSGPARMPPCMPRVAPFLARPVQQRRGVYTAALTTGTEGAIFPCSLCRKMLMSYVQLRHITYTLQL